MTTDGVPSNACLGEPQLAWCVECGDWCAMSAPIITHRGVIATMRCCPTCEERAKELTP